jgi:LysM repeat protein
VVFLVLILGSLLFISSDSEFDNVSSLNFNNKTELLDEGQYLSRENIPSSSELSLNIIGEEQLCAVAPPFSISGRILGSWGNGEVKEITEYIVQEGDTLSSVAEDFEISLETVLWANDLSKKSLISPGQKLIILPVTGILHIVRERDTLSEIAEIYQADLEEILEFNGIFDETAIYPGDTLIIPGGEEPVVSSVSYQSVPLADSFFICPIPAPCRITQGLHWQNAIDFSNGRCGDPVFAAAGGVVQKKGYTSLGGNFVRISHPNGVITYYGHLSKSILGVGQKVFQGQIIGYVGNTGYTIPSDYRGCHLHFDVIFAENPFAQYSVGTCLGQ